MATHTEHEPTRLLNSEPFANAFRAMAKDVPTLVVTMLQNVTDHIHELFMALASVEVAKYCGPPRKRSTGDYRRWGTNPGSITLGSERIPVRVPRVRNIKTNKEQPLACYTAMHKRNPKQAWTICKQLLLGLSQRTYRQAVQQCIESFGLSASTVGRMFVEETTRWLEAFEQRTFEAHQYMAVFLDGKTLRQQQMIVCMGITTKGHKHVLAMVESKTENAAAVKSMLGNLFARGFRHTAQLLVIIDGAKGLSKGVRAAFGDAALIQRCQWHKRENVARKFKNKEKAKNIRKRMQRAYEAPTYAQARRKLDTLAEELDKRCPRAAASLREGLEETLTLHKLGVQGSLRDSLKTTNIIESVNSMIAHQTRNVKRWSNTDQRHRWLGTIGMLIEQQLTRIPPSDGWDRLVAKLSGNPVRETTNPYLPTPPMMARVN